MKKTILVLDRVEYREKQEAIKTLFRKEYGHVEIVYTTYETELIRKVRRWKWIGNLLQHILYWILSYQYAVRIHKSGEGKQIICINPIVGIFLGLKNRKHGYKMLMCGFLFEPKKNQIYYNLRKKITQRAMQGIDHMVVYSRKEVQYYGEIFPMYKHFSFLQFGMDYFENQAYDGELPKTFLFSGGGSNRDYQILLRCYEKSQEDIGIPLVIATKPQLIEERYKNQVTVLSDVIVENFGTILAQAKCLVLPLYDGDISTGHMVLLQALKENVPVIINRISAIEDYVTDKDVLFYRSGDVDDLSDKIQMFLNGEWTPKQTRNKYEKYYTFEALLQRIINLMKES